MPIPPPRFLCSCSGAYQATVLNQRYWIRLVFDKPTRMSLATEISIASAGHGNAFLRALKTKNDNLITNFSKQNSIHFVTSLVKPVCRFIDQPPISDRRRTLITCTHNMRSKPCAQNSASGNQTRHRVFSDSIRQLDSPGLQNRHDNKIFGVRICAFAYRMLYMGPLRTRPQPTGSCSELPAYSLTTDSLFEQRQCLGKHGLWTTVMNQSVSRRHARP